MFFELQFEYADWLANEYGCPGMEEWRKQMFMAPPKPEKYRDEWDDDHLVAEAHEHFKRFLWVASFKPHLLDWSIMEKAILFGILTFPVVVLFSISQ